MIVINHKMNQLFFKKKYLYISIKYLRLLTSLLQRDEKSFAGKVKLTLLIIITLYTFCTDMYNMYKTFDYLHNFF